MIKIDDLIPLLKPGFVAMNLNGTWGYHKSKPVIGEVSYRWINYSDELPRDLSFMFDIAPFAGDWKDSLIEIKAKEGTPDPTNKGKNKMSENRKAESLLENYQSLSTCYNEMREEKEVLIKKLEIALNFINNWKNSVTNAEDNPFVIIRNIQMTADLTLKEITNVGADTTNTKGE